MRDQILQLLQPSDEPYWFERLQQMGLGTVLPVLIEVVEDQARPSDMRGRAVIALGHFQDARATAALMEVLSSDEPVLRARAAAALGRIEETSPVIEERLVTCLADTDAYVRRSAAEALGQLGAAGALPGLEAMSINDEVEANRRIAAGAIEQITGYA